MLQSTQVYALQPDGIGSPLTSSIAAPGTMVGEWIDWADRHAVGGRAIALSVGRWWRHGQGARAVGIRRRWASL